MLRAGSLLMVVAALAACGGNSPGRTTARPPAGHSSGGATIISFSTDRRPLSWGGTLGSFSEIRQIIATQRIQVLGKGSRPGIGFDQVWVLVLQRTASGWVWLRAVSSDRGMTLTPRGVQVHARDAKPGARSDAASGRKFVPFIPVPAEALTALKTALENTPVPTGKSSACHSMVVVEVSTSTRHVRACFPGTLTPAVTPGGRPSPAQASRHLGDMANRLAVLFVSNHPDK
jgi:hypothetical protein